MILAIPSIAIGKVFLKFLSELYCASDFYRYRSESEEHPEGERVENKIADAADSVLAGQEGKDEEPNTV